MQKIFNFLAQIPSEYKTIWSLFLFVFKLLGKRGEIMKEKLESPCLFFEPFIDMIPWDESIHGELASNSPYHGGTVSVSQRHNKLHQRDFVHIKVINNPKLRGKNSEAKKVFAKVTFYGLKSNEILLDEMYGRWAESKQPSQSYYHEELNYIDIQAGEEKTLDISTKYIIHDEWYAFNTESYTQDHFEVEMNNLKSDGYKFKVVVNAQGINEITKWFAVTKNKNGSPKIIEIPATYR